MANEIMRADAGAGNVALVEPMEEANVSGLVRLAIERGVDVEVLERLVALQERVTDRNARTAFLEALAAFQAECPPLPRSKVVDYVTKTGARVHYRFAPLEEIARITRPFLTKHHLSYTWDSAVTNGELEVTCTLYHIEGASRSASYRCTIGEAGSPTMSGPQKAGSATAYGQRYSLIQVLGLTTADEDRDGAAAEGTSETISDHEAADLAALMDEIGVKHSRLLKWAKIQEIGDLPKSGLPEALRILEGMRQEAAR